MVKRCVKKEKVMPKIKYKNLKINYYYYYYFIFGITFPFTHFFNFAQQELKSYFQIKV